MRFFILKIMIFILIMITNLSSLSISSDDDYQVYEEEKYTIIYTNEYIHEAKFIKDNIEIFLEQNNKSFGFSFDEPIKIVLISNNIQVPNAFSTQVPFNMGVYFNGGGDKNDYFANNSWLITLFTHEMIHNYQTNAKKSKISKTLHKYLGNNYMPVVAFAPFFTLPNLLLPTALLEGNAVLNESLYKNGGRLYSGRFNALKNSLVFGDKVNPKSFINDHLSFPYTQEKYIVGGFYMQYLAIKYGIDKVNQFFYVQSIHSINPLILNKTFIKHFGIGFEQSILDFVKYTKNEYKGYLELKQNKILTSSKDEVYLSKVDNKIYFISTDLKTKKVLNIYNVDDATLIQKDTTLTNGKIFKVDGKIYTSSSDFISSRLYKYGLFDEDNIVLNSSIGKSIQSIIDDKIAYIDIKNSFLSSKLYIDGKFYSTVASSAIFSKNQNIYYFKQNGIKRELYKNKTKIYEFDGYSSKVIDVVDESVYFISNTKNGSGLYKYEDGKLVILNKSDNIIDAKVINKNKILVVTVDKNGYDIQVLEDIKEKKISIGVSANINLKKEFTFSTNIDNSTLLSKNYNELSQLEFSLLYPSYSYDSVNGSRYMLNSLFTDPIMFNMLNLYMYKDFDKKLAGIQYVNERYIPFSFNIYDVNRDMKYENERGFGANFEVYGPLLKRGRDILNISIKQYFDDENKNKNPTSISLNHIYKENFILADYEFLLSDAKAVVKYDRGDKILGIDYKATKHIEDEFYIDMQLKSLKSGSDISKNEQRGIEIVSSMLETNLDDTNIFIEGIDSGFYVKNIDKISLGFAKTLHYNYYFSKFPLSLRKESIFLKYNHFKLETIKQYTIKESIVGVKFDLLYFHKLPIPTTIKYIENDFSKDDYKVTVTIGMEF